jgi:hypothetical protein
MHSYRYSIVRSYELVRPIDRHIALRPVAPHCALRDAAAARWGVVALGPLCRTVNSKRTIVPSIDYTVTVQSRSSSKAPSICT